jgi:hypothetical protein
MTQKGSEGRQNFPPPHITDLSPHSRCVVTPSGDVNNTTDVQFQLFSGGVNCWNAVVSTGEAQVELPADLPCGPVTYRQGLKLEYRAGAIGSYLILLSGSIVDQSQPYPFTPYLVIFQSPEIAERTD